VAFDLLCTNWTEPLLARIIFGGNMADAGGNRANKVFQFFGPDVKTVFASQHKNVEAMMEANRLALDGVQAVWRRQLDFIQKAIEGLTALFDDLAAKPGPMNERFAKHAEYSKQAFERNLANTRELTELATKASSDAINIINQRFCKSLDEVRSTQEK
jgi:phasin family protein